MPYSEVLNPRGNQDGSLGGLVNTYVKSLTKAFEFYKI